MTKDNNARMQSPITKADFDSAISRIEALEELLQKFLRSNVAGTDIICNERICKVSAASHHRGKEWSNETNDEGKRMLEKSDDLEEGRESDKKHEDDICKSTTPPRFIVSRGSDDGSSSSSSSSSKNSDISQNCRSLPGFSALHNAAKMEGGIHAWILYKITESSCSSINRIVLPLMSWLVILFQVLVLTGLGYESDTPRCRNDDDCEYRQQQCSNVVDITDSSFNFCGATEEKSVIATEDCPFLVNIVMKLPSKIVMIFVFVYVLSAVLLDIEQNHESTQAAWYRIQENDRTKDKWVAFNVWGISFARTYFLPFLTFWATVLILYLELDFDVSTVLMNGVAMMMIGGTGLKIDFVFLFIFSERLVPRYSHL